MDRKFLAALSLGAVLGGGATLGAEALTKPPQPPVKITKTELMKRQQTDGGFAFYERVNYRDLKNQNRWQRSGYVVDAKQIAVCNDYWKLVVEAPEKLVDPQAVRDGGH